MKTRLITGGVYLAIIVAMLLLREWTEFLFDPFIIVLASWASLELMKAKKLEEKGVRDYYFYPYIGISYMIFLIGILIANPFAWWLHIVLQLVLVGGMVVYVWIMSLTDEALAKRCKLQKLDHGKEAKRIVARYLHVMLYPIIMMFALIVLNHIDRFATVTNGNVVSPAGLARFAILLVFVITILTDTLAFATGKVFKGKKLCPNISPNKTWSGAIGGLFGGLLGSLIVLWLALTNSNLAQFLHETIGYSTGVIIFFAVVGLLGAVATMTGDLYASYQKRKAGIKDFGKILPGHGGVLDRIDGLIFTSVFIFFVSMLLLIIHAIQAV